MGIKQKTTPEQNARNLAVNKLDDSRMLGYGISQQKVVEDLGGQDYFRLPLIGENQDISGDLVHWLIAMPDKGRTGIKGIDFGFLNINTSVQIKDILKQVISYNNDIEDKRLLALLERSVKILSARGQQIISALEVKQGGKSGFSTEIVIPKLWPEIIPVDNAEQKIIIARKLGLCAIYHVANMNKIVSRV